MRTLYLYAIFIGIKYSEDINTISLQLIHVHMHIIMRTLYLYAIF